MRTVTRKGLDWLPNLDVAVDQRSAPVFTPDDFAGRIERLREKMLEKMPAYTEIVVYGDREHYSNIEYLTGYDPRFEEALFIIPREGTPTIIVGNEGAGYSEIIGFDVRRLVFPSFSLPGQPRRALRPLSALLRDAGLSETSVVGVIGWKGFTEADCVNPEETFDLPHFIMQTLTGVVSEGLIRNVIDLLIGLDGGLRTRLDTKEAVLSEIAGTLSSRSSYEALRNMREGMTEVEVSEFLRINGQPLSVHPNVNFGRNMFLGLASPMTDALLRRGEAAGVGIAYRRSLCHKVGFYVGSGEEAPEGYDAFCDTYFHALAAWYESLQLGATGNEVYETTSAACGGLEAFGISLNPGHFISTEEWVNSPFQPGCGCALESGMALQCDFTATQSEKGLTIHAEDGVILADAALREEIRLIAPESWKRIVERRRFVKEVLGLNLAEEVLPTSDLPAVVFPYLRNLGVCVAYE